jgi:UDP-N-acetylglucosamine transferase subunit ALG13
LIFVSLGTDGHQFERALDVIEPIAQTNHLVVQHGATPPRREWSSARWVEFVGYELQLELMRTAKGVITHAGVGSIMSALGVGQRPIVIARRADLGEHVDDHQLQIATELSRRGLVIPALTSEDIRAALTGSPLKASWTPQGGLRRAAVAAAGEIV